MDAQNRRGPVQSYVKDMIFPMSQLGKYDLLQIYYPVKKVFSQIQI